MTTIVAKKPERIRTTRLTVSFGDQIEVERGLISNFADSEQGTGVVSSQVFTCIAEQLAGETMNGEEIAKACINGIWMAGARGSAKGEDWMVANMIRTRWFLNVHLLLEHLCGWNDYAYYIGVLALEQYGFEVNQSD